MELLILNIGIFYFFAYYFKKIKFIYFIFVLPGTFMHELAHLIIAFFTNGKPYSFSLIPKKQKDGYTLGSVEVSNITFYNAIFIAFAPLLNIYLAYLVYLNFNFTNDLINKENYIYAYFIFNLLNSSIPSEADFKVTLKKPSSYIFILIVSYIIYEKYSIIIQFTKEVYQLCLKFI